MTKSGMNPKVDWFFSKAEKWQEEFKKLRKLVLACEGLTEELRWGKPCYTFQEANIVLIHGFKEYCALLFFKGALLKDPKGILIQQTQNVQAARQIRFTSVRQVVEMEPVLKAYVYEAIEVEKAGLKVDYKKTSDFKIPEEFQIRNSNAYSLAVQVARAGGVPKLLPIARDTVEHTREMVGQGLVCDLLLLSGGVSAGKYDVVLRALPVDERELHHLAFGGRQHRIDLAVDLAAHPDIDHAPFGNARTQRIARVRQVADIGAGRSGRS